MPDFQFTEENPQPAAPSSPAPDASETPPPAPAAASGFQFVAADAPLVPPATPPATAKTPVAPIPGPPIPAGLIPNPPIPPGLIPNPPLPTATPGAPTPGAPTPGAPTPGAPTPGAPTPGAPTPGAPTPGAPTPARPVATPPVAAPKVPIPVVPNPPVPRVAAPPVATPTVPTPQAPTPQVPVPRVPAPQIPTPNAAQPPVAPRPPAPATNATSSTPVPRAAPVPIAIPAPDAKKLDVIEDRIDDNAPQDAFSRKIWDAGQKGKAVLDALEGPASWILRVAVVVGVCALAYILAATFAGGAGAANNPKMALLTKNLDLASKAFVFSLLGAAIASLLLGYEDNRLGAIVCAIGVVFHFVMPIALKQVAGDTPAISVMATHFRHGGYYLVMIGLVKAVFDTAVWLWNLPDRMKSHHANVGVSNQAEAKQRIIAREANMFSPCWKLPFCRESIRKQCPAFLAKKTCWKFGRGCYCDTEMISRIVRGESLELIKAPTQQSRQGKPPCGRCYIYLEHQTYKFRVLSPLALPVAVLTTWLIWPLYSQVFKAGDKIFNSIWNSLSFNSANLTSGMMKSSEEGIEKTAQLGSRPEDIAFIAQNMFGVLLGFMLLIYLSKFIEWAIYKAKW